jgi:hypothetical protein
LSKSRKKPKTSSTGRAIVTVDSTCAITSPLACRFSRLPVVKTTARAKNHRAL